MKLFKIYEACDEQTTQKKRNDARRRQTMKYFDSAHCSLCIRVIIRTDEVHTRLSTLEVHHGHSWHVPSWWWWWWWSKYSVGWMRSWTHWRANWTNHVGGAGALWLLLLLLLMLTWDGEWWELTSTRLGSRVTVSQWFQQDSQWQATETTDKAASRKTTQTGHGGMCAFTSGQLVTAVSSYHEQPPQPGFCGWLIHAVMSWLRDVMVLRTCPEIARLGT